MWARSGSGRRAVAALGVAATLLVALATTPAGATTAATGQQPPPQPARTVLFLSVIPSNDVARTVILTCDPPGGSHPRPTEACDLLDEAGGDFTRLTGDPYAGACLPDLVDPVLATAFGWWQGRLTWYYRWFQHSCHLELGTWFVYHRAFRPEPPP
jgi:hypothetical protein